MKPGCTRPRVKTRNEHDSTLGAIGGKENHIPRGILQASLAFMYTWVPEYGGQNGRAAMSFLGPSRDKKVTPRDSKAHCPLLSVCVCNALQVDSNQPVDPRGTAQPRGASPLGLANPAGESAWEKIPNQESTDADAVPALCFCRWIIEGVRSIAGRGWLLLGANQ